MYIYLNFGIQNMIDKTLFAIFMILQSMKIFSQTLVNYGDNSWGIQNGKSIVKIDMTIDAAAPFSPFSNGLCPVKIQGKWCYINSKAEIVIKTDYDEIYDFNSGIAEVVKNKKLGFINTNGDLITDIQFDFDNLTFYHRDDNYLFVKKNGIASLLNKNGQEIITEKNNFSFIGFFSQTSENEYFSFFYNDDLCAVQRDNKWGFVNLKGELVIPCEYDSYRPFFKGISPVSKNGKWGLIDKNNKILIPFMFDDISNYDTYYGHSYFDDVELKGYEYFNSGLCPVGMKVEGELRWGFINQIGQIVIPIKYNRVENFNSEGMADVYLNGEYFIIDTTGNRVGI